uniref:Uncharacterized protein n=1 Tax=Anolis carolinensis TaxID=28377 RepID=A0A803SQ34_ANOCA
VAFWRRARSHPLFSQDFLIHNHANIAFCLVLCVLVSLMFKVSSSPLPLLAPRSPLLCNGFTSITWVRLADKQV